MGRPIGKISLGRFTLHSSRRHPRGADRDGGSKAESKLDADDALIHVVRVVGRFRDHPEESGRVWPRNP